MCKTLRRPTEVQLLGDGDKVTKVAKFHERHSADRPATEVSHGHAIFTGDHAIRPNDPG